MSGKDELATAIQTAAVKIRTAFVEHYPLGTPLDVFETIIHEALDPIFARQQARVEEVTRERDDALHAAALARRALEDLKRMNGNVDEYMEYGAKAERMKWEYALEACRKSISPRTEAENG